MPFAPADCFPSYNSWCSKPSLDGMTLHDRAGKTRLVNEAPHLGGARQTKLTACCDRCWDNSVKSLWIPCEHVRAGR